MSEKENVRKIEVVEHNENWSKKYQEEAKKITAILGGNIINIHHIGSTAIPSIKAKPVIDILVEVKNIEKIDEYNDQMASLGYEAMGESGIEGRRFFRKGGNNRTHHVHVFQAGSEEIERHINFRDYMTAHPDEAMQYSQLKDRVAKEYTYDIQGYMAGKNSFIKEIDKKAKAWKEKQNRGQ